jgi:hypothetical protein
MAKYEYTIVQSKILSDDEKTLNDLGQQGWLVVGVDNFHSSTERAKYVLMREIEG